MTIGSVATVPEQTQAQDAANPVSTRTVTRTAMQSFEYTLPAVRGFQAGREFFVTMCPAKLLASIFPDSIAGLPPQLEAQRVINRQRIPAIVRYITTQVTSYTLDAMTASIDSPVVFEPVGDGKQSICTGTLRVPLASNLLLHDGLHRCAALKEAVKQNPKLGDESIPLVIFVDYNFKRSDHIFSDLKQHERKTSCSLRVFYDDRDEFAHLTRDLISRVPLFVNSIEMKRSTISNRSRKLFTLSALYQANKILLADRKQDSYDTKLSLAVEFWSEVSKRMTEWSNATVGRVSPAELRKTYVHAHGIALSALARTGRTLVNRYPRSWKKKLGRLRTLDWSRDNRFLWEGRAMVGGRLSKTNSCVVLTGNAVKAHLGIPLTEDEQEIEDQFTAGK
ncbi:MAG: DNA sulfur modification protein DndB [Pirellulaceae bacterium]